MIVYLAGAYRSRWGLLGRCWNILQAWLAGRRVVRCGVMVCIPHLNCALYDGLQDDQFFLDGTLELLKRSDAILMLPSWRESSGSRGEHDWAEANGMPIFYGVDELRRWLADYATTHPLAERAAQ